LFPDPHRRKVVLESLSALKTGDVGCSRFFASLMPWRRGTGDRLGATAEKCIQNLADHASTVAGMEPLCRPLGSGSTPEILPPFLFSGQFAQTPPFVFQCLQPVPVMHLGCRLYCYLCSRLNGVLRISRRPSTCTSRGWLKGYSHANLAKRDGPKQYVVDDDDDILKVVVPILKHANFRVLSANSGPNALKIAKKTTGKIDLLLSDVDMAQMSGPDLGEAMKKARPDLHVMLMSGGSKGNLLVLNYGWDSSRSRLCP